MPMIEFKNCVFYIGVIKTTVAKNKKILTIKSVIVLNDLFYPKFSQMIFLGIGDS